MKKKLLIVGWNAFVDAIPILVPIILNNKDKILKCVKKIKV
jgi:hypothetical protein